MLHGEKFDNAKDVLWVVTYMGDTMKTFEDNKMPEYLYDEEAKSILKNKILELALVI